jgi:hypothetical protein
VEEFSSELELIVAYIENILDTASYKEPRNDIN